MALSELSPLRFDGRALELLDQLRLPAEERWIRCDTEEEVGRAIREMNVRGAPAIGIAAAYGMAIAARRRAALPEADFRSAMGEAAEMLAGTRPTAVNLFWALAEMKRVMNDALAGGSAAATAQAMADAARAIHDDDIVRCRRIGEHGAPLIPDGARVLTHCNAGALATGGFGTALGVLRAAKQAGKSLKVLAGETRPYLQGARLTAWELLRDGFDVELIPDSAGPFLIARGELDCAIVGADRIARNGDVANKIGTYSIALAAHAHGIPFYVAAPVSTIDLDTSSGADIPIEERGGDELTRIGEISIAPAGTLARYPAFDITPAELISAIITDSGVFPPGDTHHAAKPLQLHRKLT
jgi:methylthioribose-1-phosphate isomerase